MFDVVGLPFVERVFTLREQLGTAKKKEEGKARLLVWEANKDDLVFPTHPFFLSRRYDTHPHTHTHTHTSSVVLRSVHN